MAEEKSKELPVIIFYKNDTQKKLFKQSLKRAEFFEGNNGEKLCMLDDLRTKQVKPNHILFTSNKNSLG